MNKMEKSLYFRDALDSGRLTKAGARSPALMKKKMVKENMADITDITGPFNIPLGLDS